MATTGEKVLSVNVGTAREFESGGRPAKSAIWKSPVVGLRACKGGRGAVAKYLGRQLRDEVVLVDPAPVRQTKRRLELVVAHARRGEGVYRRATIPVLLQTQGAQRGQCPAQAVPGHEHLLLLEAALLRDFRGDALVDRVQRRPEAVVHLDPRAQHWLILQSVLDVGAHPVVERVG